MSKPRPIVVRRKLGYVPLSQGQTAVIDAEDAPLVADLNWHALWVPHTSSFIAKTSLRTIGNPKISMHRLITGALPSQLVDHIDHDTLNNRRSNLRVCNTVQNARNRQRSCGASGYLGVYQKSENSFAVVVRHDGRAHHLGSFKTAEAAAHRRDDYIRENFPDDEFWTLNFP